MPYEALKMASLLTLRGDRSQASVSRALGYTHNQAHKWESGQKALRWPEFVALCQASGVDLPRILREVLGYHADTTDAAQLFRHVLDGRRIEHAARGLGFSRHKLSRWVLGKAVPTFEEVLRVIDVYAGKLPQLAASLGLPEKSYEVDDEEDDDGGFEI